MGIYVNPGNAAFRKALNSEIYVDKTELIAVTNRRINTSDCFLCVSRQDVLDNLWRRTCCGLL